MAIDARELGLGDGYEDVREERRGLYRARFDDLPVWVVIVEGVEDGAPPLLTRHDAVLHVFDSRSIDGRWILGVERFSGFRLWRILQRHQQMTTRAGAPCTGCGATIRPLRCDVGVQVLCDRCGAMFEWRALAAGPSPDPGVLVGAPLWWPDVLAIMLPVIDAIEHIRRHPIPRLPLDPDHIVISTDGEVRLAPPTLVGLTAMRAVHSHTRRRSIPRYISPQFIRRGDFEDTDDVYTVAALLYELSTGHHPTPSKTETDWELLTGIGAPVLAPSVHVSDYPGALERLLVRGLAKEPADRPPLRELRHLLAELGPASRADELATYARALLDPNEGPILGLIP